jgi:hypothetical protein
MRRLLHEGLAARASVERPGEGDGQSLSQGGDRVLDLALGSDRGRLGVVYDRKGQRLEAPGSSDGDWSVSTAARSTCPTSRSSRPPSVGPAQVTARAPIRKSASSAWWKTGRMSCSEPGWRAARPAKSLTKDVLSALAAGMPCLADRNFFGYEMWRQAQAKGADLLWRIKRNARLPCEEPLPDGSYLSHIYPSETDRRHETNGVKVRVIDYRLEGVADAEPIYRLVTTILDPAIASAKELAALYHERWEIETALGELKTYVRAGKIVLRSKTQEWVRQEFFGMLMLHYAIRGLMHEAALSVDEDPDRLSFLHAIRVVRRKLPMSGAFSPSAQACAA